MTDMAAAGGADAAAPAPILGSDVLLPFADLLPAPDAEGLAAEQLATVFATALPASGKGLPVARQDIAVEEDQDLSSAMGDNADEDDDAIAGEAMWLPLSLDLPTVVARGPVPIAAPATVAADGEDAAEMQATERSEAGDRRAEAVPMLRSVAPPVAMPAGEAVVAAVPPVADTGDPETGPARAVAGESAAPSLPAGTRNAGMARPVAGTAGNMPAALAPIADPAPMPAAGVTALSAPVVETAAATAVAPTSPSGPAAAAPAPSPMPASPPALPSAAVDRPTAEAAPSPIPSAPVASPSRPAVHGVSAEPALPVARLFAGSSSVTPPKGDESTVPAPIIPVPGPSPRPAMPATGERSISLEARGRDSVPPAAPSIPVEVTPVQPIAADDSQMLAPLVVAAAPAGISAPAAPESTRPPQTPMLDTARADWLDGLIDRVEEARANGPVRVTHMRLLPDALGALEVRIRVEGERVHVTFTTDSPDARAIIADAAPKLAEMAETRGLRLGQTQVDLGAGGGSQQRATHDRAADQPAAPAPVRRDRADAETDAEPAPARPRATRDRLA